MDFSYKMVDTCAAEFDAMTPYFYSTTDKDCESRSFRRSGKPVIMVLGSGPIRIGQGIEFDYSSVHCVWTLREMGYEFEVDAPVDGDHTRIRLVTSWATPEGAIDQFLKDLAACK